MSASTSDSILSTTLAAPLYPTLDIYPSMPITTFPPAMPAVKRTLRERCGIDLSISTAFMTTSTNPMWSPKLHTQPHRTNLPRRRKPQKRFAHVVKVEETPVEEKPMEAMEMIKSESVDSNLDFVESTWTSSTAQIDINSSPPNPEHHHHLEEIIPSLHVAFSDGLPSSQLPGYSIEKPYTHVVNIVYPPTNSTDDSFAGSTEQFYECHIQKLRLVLPASARVKQQENQRPGLGLTDTQLRAVRDFLSEALPKSLASQEDQSGVNILITAPHGRPTDVMCAAGCYLAFTSGRGVQEILRIVDDEEDMLSIWKAEVSEDEVDRVEKIAKNWSWISQVNGHPVTETLDVAGPTTPL